ncbi:MAG TPA: S53 family peptidase [Tepidisphaeraceae bacterium]|nr:S53 family peptidase [Tepidisphaeraceae bacterium]
MNAGKKRPQQDVRTHRRFSGIPEPLESRCMLSASACGIAVPDATLQPAASSATTVAGFTPSQIRTAYGLNQVSGTGAGQTIAIVDAYNDPNIVSDLGVFDSHFGLTAPPSFKVVGQSGGSTAGIATDAGWAGEISLDVEWTHAIAPGANILLVEANSATLTNLLAAVNYARNATGVSVVSMSWGGSEFYGQTQDDSTFTTPAGHNGVTFIAASGDEGSRYGVEWPASSPNVLSVGGTTLTVASSSGLYGTQSPWSDSTGGYSAYEREPAFQRDVQSSGARTVPDVSTDANPATGYAVYDSVPYYGSSGWAEYGGTSAGAPQWAGLVAICDQTRVADKLGTLDGPSQTLPALYAPAANGSTYAVVFHDVTSLSYGFSRFGRFSQETDIGYDLATGLGTENGPGTATVLTSKPTTTTSTTSTSQTGSISVQLQHPTQQGPKDVQQGQPVSSPSQSQVAPPPSSQPGTVAQAPAPAPAALPTVFNDTLIHHDVAAVAVRAGPVRLDDLSAPQPVAALASATAAVWLGQVDGALVSWLSGHGDAKAAGPASALAAKAGSMAAISNPAPASLAHSAAALASQIVAPTMALPANIIYRFANFDPVATFSDAMADFARESASLSPIATVSDHPSHRAWWITGAVLGVDAMLAGRWYLDRAARRKEKQSDSTSKDHQAGLLPSGL